MFIKLFLFGLLSCTWITRLHAQVTLALQVPPAGLMQKNQLWNMALVNTGNTSVSVYVGLTVSAVHDNRPVMTALSAPVLLLKGTRYISNADIAPVQYTYLSSSFNADQDPNGFMPAGNYKACYTIYKSGEGREPLAEDCLPVEVQPLSPPLLNLPADTSAVNTMYPQFNWLPPVPLQLFSNLSYDLIVVEVIPGQNPYEAVQKNIPVYNTNNLKDMIHLYPASGKPLDTARTYAWKVIARNEAEYVAQSEVWTFTIKALQQPAVALTTVNYILLRNRNQPSGINTVENGVIGIKYYSFDSTHEAVIRFLGQDGKVVKEEKSNILYGDNFLSYKLTGAFIKGRMYSVEITDQQASVYKASFLVK